MRFKTKPIKIEAHCWDGDWQELAAWIDVTATPPNGTYFTHRAIDNFIYLKLTVDNFDRIISRGEWIVCTDDGNYIVMSSERFKQEYEAA